MARKQRGQENLEYEQPAKAPAGAGEVQPQTPAAEVPAGQETAGQELAGQVPAAETQPQIAQPQDAPAPPQYKIRRTRISGLWVSIGCFAVVLLLLLIFILQNSHTVDISYFGIHSHLPLGVALLLATVCGILLVVLAGTARILQLRTAARRHRRADNQNAQPPRPRTPAP
jgi:uncharacterized integral membrane protein